MDKKTTGKSMRFYCFDDPVWVKHTRERCFAYPVEITKTKRAGAGLVKSIPIRNSLALTSNQNV